jgi:esterase/lipase superfamily enzyme
MLPSEQALPDDATVHQIYVATTRARIDGGQLFGPDRGTETSYARLDVSVPPTHIPGQIEWPRNIPDPEQHFVLRSGVRMPEPTNFNQSLAQAASRKSGADGEVAVFVHGYNANFAEALFRFAQTVHDFDIEAVPVLFSWASSASTVGYIYDRDSALLARDGLVDLLADIDASGIRGTTLVAHSMGAMLLMESLRQISLAGQSAKLKNIRGIVLISPDIDLEVFEAQARVIGPLPQPFVVISSQADRALQVSGSLAGDRSRLGSVTNAETLQGLNVTVVDVTSLSKPGSLNHLSSVTSPDFITLVRNLGTAGPTLDNELEKIEGVSVVEVFDRAKEITLQPFRN